MSQVQTATATKKHVTEPETLATDRQPTIVTFRDAFVLGGKTITNSIENRERSNESFRVDWRLGVVWVRIDLGSRVVQGWTPFSNVLSCSYAPETTEKPA